MKFLRSASGSEMFLNGALCTPVPEITTDPKLNMRPNTLWSTWMLSIFSRNISMVRR